MISIALVTLSTVLTGGAIAPSAIAPPSAHTAKNQLVARLSAPTHRPRVGHAWRITITARTAAGRPVKAEVRYQYLSGGQIVARRSHYRFTGTFHDNVVWTAQSVGIPLTFRAVVTSSIGNRNLDYAVQVQR